MIMRTIKFLLAILLSLAVVACGGGGGYGGGGSMGGSSAIYSISGTVTGAVVSGVMINLTGPRATSTTTNTLGNYSFTNLANGNYVVTPVPFGIYTSFTPPSTAVPISFNNPTGINFVEN
jgi:SdrD B-like domain